MEKQPLATKKKLFILFKQTLLQPQGKSPIRQTNDIFLYIKKKYFVYDSNKNVRSFEIKK